MRRIPLLLLFAASLAAALPAFAQGGTPRRPPADTVRFGTTRPAAGDSIAMAEYDEADGDKDAPAAARGRDEADADEDTVPVKPRSGPYSRAGGSGGPFSVQASGETAARPPRGEVVRLTGRAARPAASDSSRRDTARAGTGPRVASGTSARRDTASSTTTRPAARRDSASSTTTRPARRDSAAATTANRTRRDTASSATAGRTRRDTVAIASRPAARDTARRGGQAASTAGGRTGSAPATTSASTSGRAGSTSTTSSARPRTHTVAAGETFYAIARRYGVTAAQMRAINPDVEMDALEIGDVLRLPASARDSRAGSTSGSQRTGSASTPGSQRTGTQTPPRTGSQASPAARRTHTVAAGETLFGIARRYGVTVDAIREANDLEGDGLRTGQRLTIPPAR